MLTIFARTIKDRKRSLIIYSLVGVGLLWVYIVLFPFVQSQAESFSDLFKNYPEGFAEAFGIGELSFSTLESFLAIEQFSFVWPILAIILLVSLAARGLAGEVEKGTAEIVLARPVSRVNIFVGRYLAGVFTLAVFLVFSIFSVIPLAELHNIDYALQNYVALAVISFLFGLAVFSVAMLLSAVASERSRVYMGIGGLLITMYVLNIVSALKDSLGSLRYFSFFHYYDPNQALIHNTIGTASILVFIIVILICIALGILLFSKRDIKIV